MEALPDEPDLERRVVRSLHIFVDPVVRECRREMTPNPMGHDDIFDKDPLGTINVYPLKPKEEPEDLVA